MVRVTAFTIVVFILLFTTFPSADPTAAGPMCVICGDRGLADAILNVVMFVPLGLAVGMLVHPVAAIVAGALISSGIELIQILVPGRHPSLGDVAFNAAGALTGTVLLVVFKNALQLRPRASVTLAAVAAGAALTVLAGGGWLLRPASLETADFYAQWTPRFPNMARYDGTVLAASIDTLSVGDGRVGEPDELAAAVRRGGAVEISVHIGTPPVNVAPIFALAAGPDDQILLIGAHEDQLVYRYRTRGKELRLDSPDLRVGGVFTRATQGDTLLIRVDPARGGRVVTITVGERTVVSRPSALDTWGLLYWSDFVGRRVWLRHLVRLVWIGALFSPALILLLVGWRSKRGSVTRPN